ncbi:MAG: hypothetical protein ACXWKP_06120 [Bradyrhizobium sp.]
MEVTKFKATQEPIKALYSKDANAAFLTLKARGSASDSTVTCKVETGRGLALAGIHPKAGGTGQELCSGDMLLEALIACAGVSKAIWGPTETFYRLIGLLSREAAGAIQSPHPHAAAGRSVS